MLRANQGNIDIILSPELLLRNDNLTAINTCWSSRDVMIENTNASYDFLSFLYFSWNFCCIAWIAYYYWGLGNCLAVSDADYLAIVTEDELIELLIEDVGASMYGTHSI